MNRKDTGGGRRSGSERSKGRPFGNRPARSGSEPTGGRDKRRPSNDRSVRQGKREASPGSSLFKAEESMELLSFLLLKLGGKSRNSIKSLLARGQVSVNGQKVTAYNCPLENGDAVAVDYARVVEPLLLIGLDILHEDDDLIVVHKEAGLLSIASDKSSDQELTAYRQLTAYVREQSPSNRIFVVHRLDKDTSGVMMFAKNEQSKQRLQQEWRERVTERTYVALVEGRVKKAEGTIESWLRESSTLKMYSSLRRDDGLHAITRYRLLETGNAYSLLEVSLETGRKNQIRVHMEDIGHPVAGDKKYGSKSRSIGRMGLHAQVLAFIHPATEKAMRFETDIPKLFLAALRGR